MTGIGRALAAILLASAVAGAAVFAHLLAGGSGTRPSVLGSLPPAPSSPLVVQATALPQPARAPVAPLSPVLPRSGVLHSAFTRRATTPAPGPVTHATATRPLVAQPPVAQAPVAQPPVAQPPAIAPIAPGLDEVRGAASGLALAAYHAAYRSYLEHDARLRAGSDA